MIKRFLFGLFAGSVATTALAEYKWTVATTEDNGRPLIVRYRASIPEEVKKESYPNLIVITWKFQSNSGMPSAPEKERMNELEDSVSNLVEAKNQALLTLVVTGNEVSEWQFYTRTHEDFMQLLNQALAQKPEFPIQVSLQTDPEWSAYERFSGTP